MRQRSAPTLCPSYRCEEGAWLIGVVQPDGSVAFTPDELQVDAAFVAPARKGRTPEARFRFAGPCHRAACAQWTGERCGVIDTLVRCVADANLDTEPSIPECAIRARCRWFGQMGVRACRLCKLVVTEVPDRVVEGT